jgi:hypothetical protein
MRLALLSAVVLCAWGCSSPPLIQDGGTPPDGGPHLLVDGGTDAGQDAGVDAGTDGGTDAGDGGLDGGPQALSCAVSAQDCDAGASCLFVEAGAKTACFSGACDLLRQDCGDKEKCDYATDDAGVTARACVPAGDAGVGERCPTLESPDGCRPGLVCVDSGDDAGTGLCERYCYADSDCAPDARCEELLRLDGTEEMPSLCVTIPPCDLLAQDCAEGTACYIGPTRPGCYPEGSVAVGGTCRVSSDCVQGAVCAQDGEGALTCRSLCGTAGAPACASGSCTPIQSPAPAGVGVCL